MQDKRFTKERAKSYILQLITLMTRPHIKFFLSDKENEIILNILKEIDADDKKE